MTKTKSTKRALLLSALSLLLCVSMLIGSTFAWFTDSVTSNGNIIQAGNLNVEMYWAEGDEDPATLTWNKVDGAIFNNDKWEPGYVEAKHVKITNEGNLAFKWRLRIVPNGTVEELADVIDVYYIEGAKQLTREMLEGVAPVCTLRDLINDVDGAAHGALLPTGETATNAYERVGEVTATLAFKMREEAGNDYQGKKIGTDFSLQLLATQYTEEEDSFGDDYDKNATYPAVDNLSHPNDNGESVLTAGDAFVALGDNAPAGKYQLVVSDKNVDTDANGETTVSYNIDLYKDGEKVSNNGVEYLVGIKVGTGLKITGLLHKGEAVAAYDYAPTGEYITFKTTSFSPFAVIYTAYPEGSTFASNSADLYTYTLQSGKTGTVVLTDDFKTSDSNKRYYSYMEYLVKGDYALDLNGHTITNDTPYTATDGAGFVYLFTLNNNSKLTVNGEGVINSSFDNGHSAIFWAFKDSELTINGGNYNVDDGIAVWAGNGSKVVINGGTYISTNAGDDELIYSSGGAIDIYGGFFHNTSRGKTLNVEDAHRSTGVMTIYGGTYVNFDPSTGGQDPNNIKVADGYKVISETQENGDIWYTVVAE